MSESAAKRQPIDLDEFERRLRGPAPAVRSEEDPLAELARIVNMGIPFGQQQRSAPPVEVEQPQMPPSPQLRVVEPSYPAEPDFVEYQQEPVERPLNERFFEPVEQMQVAVKEPQIDFGRLEQDLQQFDMPEVQSQQRAPVQAQAIDDWADQYEPRPAPQQRDMAPQMDDEALAPPPMYLADDEAEARKPRRKMLMAGAGLLVVLGAIGITLVTRGGTKTGGEPPTILAAQGPAKVQPVNPGGADVSSQASSVLDKNNVDRVSASKVVSREEQPVDLTTAPPAPRVSPAARSDQPTNSGAPVQAAASSNGFPEPKRVKTVSVRPDGTLISGDGVAAEAPRAPVAPDRPSIASLPVNPSAAVAKPPASVAPKAAAPAPVAPKPTAQTPAATKATVRVANTTPDVNGDGVSPTDTGRPASIRTSGGKPAAVAATSSGSGGYAVQLAAPPSEQEAKATASRLQAKFAGSLGSHRPSIVKATVGDKSIYRVRVNGLSKDDAAKLCSSIQSGGGACFVAKS